MKRIFITLLTISSMGAYLNAVEVIFCPANKQSYASIEECKKNCDKPCELFDPFKGYGVHVAVAKDGPPSVIN